MSKAVSYYDWELSLRKKHLTTGNLKVEKPSHTNSIGLSDEEFKNFMNNWKKKNL